MQGFSLPYYSSLPVPNHLGGGQIAVYEYWPRGVDMGADGGKLDTGSPVGSAGVLIGKGSSSEGAMDEQVSRLPSHTRHRCALTRLGSRQVNEPSGFWNLVGFKGRGEVKDAAVAGAMAADATAPPASSASAFSSAGSSPRGGFRPPGGGTNDLCGCLGSLLQVVDMLPSDWEEANAEGSGGPAADLNAGRWASDVVVHPSGKWLFAANRLHDSIASFKVNTSGAGPVLELAGRAPCGGKTPRNFSLSPDGRHLVVALQHSHSVAAFAVDAASGALCPTAMFTDAPCAACVRFL